MKRSDKLQVFAKNEEKALKKSYKILTKELDVEIDIDDIELEFVAEKEYLFGLFSRNRYNATVNKEVITGNEQTNEDDIPGEDKADKESVDGSFKVSVTDSGIYLEVWAPQNGGDMVKMESIEEVLAAKQIEGIDYAAVSDVLTLEQDKLKIAERKPELDSDAKVEINIEDQGMKAYLDYQPPLGKEALSYEDIMSSLADKEITYGVKAEEFKEAFDAQEKLEDFLIAEGDGPVAGEDAKIELKFNPDRKDNKVTILDDGSVDYYNLNRIINVKEGDLLAKKIPLVPGQEGQKVTGDTLAASQPEDMELPVGDNVKKTEDGLLLLAAMDGQVIYKEGKISVLDIYVVRGDVDLSTGNIEFEGNVIIKGNVTDGMIVKAEGNIKVHGSVYAAKLIADGQIVVNQGFIGRNKGLLKAGNSIQVEFIENGDVEAGASLIVKNAIMHSKIDAETEVKVTGGKGIIVGGEVKATELVEANIIGSGFDTSTEISVGITPEIRNEYEEIEELYQEKKGELSEKIKNLTSIKKKLKDEDKDGLLRKMKSDQIAAASRLEDIKKQYNQLKEKIESEKEGQVIIKNRIYPGVIITIGSYTKKIEREINRAELYANEAEERISSRSL